MDFCGWVEASHSRGLTYYGGFPPSTLDQWRALSGAKRSEAKRSATQAKPRLHTLHSFVLYSKTRTCGISYLTLVMEFVFDASHESQHQAESFQSKSIRKQPGFRTLDLHNSGSTRTPISSAATFKSPSACVHVCLSFRYASR
jgi:hypothetical protein